MTEADERADIVIIGAGPVGMAFSIALAEGPFRLLLIDSRSRGTGSGDPRALALSYGSRQILEAMNAWPGAVATAIHSIHVSQRGGFGRTVIDRRDYKLPALGYVLRYRDLAAALEHRLEKIRLLERQTPVALEITANEARLRVTSDQGSREIVAQLVVHAEGSPGNETGVRIRDYHQHAIVAEVQPCSPHAHRAWERFTPDGPIALLPLGNHYALVRTAPNSRVEELMHCDEEAFCNDLCRHLAGHLDLAGCGPRAAFPLTLRLRQQITAARQVWLGNAAQSLHPVSGQGFNVGLRDAWELADTLLGPSSIDPGHAPVLAAYARRRRLDRHGSAVFTDGIVRLFSNDLAPLRICRGIGLQTLDLLPPLRHYVARRMIWGARAWL